MTITQLARVVRLLRHVGVEPTATRYVLERGWSEGMAVTFQPRLAVVT